MYAPEVHARRVVRPGGHSFAEYIELEEASSTKHEWLDGQFFAMAGGTPEQLLEHLVEVETADRA